MINIEEIIISNESLESTLKKHKMWLNNEEGGIMANLRGADLRGANLRGADLRGANLSNADLSNADLRGANLRYADLSNADLRNANLRNANLRNADLRFANLRYADLRYTDLSGADLIGADLIGADLRGANLKEANLRGANLKEANLRGANLKEANLRGADLRDTNLTNIKTNYLSAGYNLACPEEGSFIGYKKANGNLIKLLILEDSKRSSATTLKCRCDKAKVLSIVNIKTGEEINSCASNRDNNFIYTVSEIVQVEDFNENRWCECATGIHFFINRECALNY